MTPRKLREEIETIDRRLAELGSWEKTLTAARQRRLLAGSDDARRELMAIEHGPRAGDGRPSDLELAPFDQGWPGLHATAQTITQLQERRALLVQQRPTDAETAERRQEAGARATAIRTRAEDLTMRTRALHAALNEAGRLALAVANDRWRLWCENAGLDRLAADADIKRPETPRYDAAAFQVATPLSVLLSAHFTDARPASVDPNLAREIREAMAEPECQASHKMEAVANDKHR